MLVEGGKQPPNGLPSSPLAHDYPRPLKIAIVGAGIGGLSAAIGLRRQGHHVELFEQSRLANETGAAVHLAPNSNGLLRRWGIFAETFGANPAQSFKERDLHNNGGFDVDITKSEGQWQHPWQLVHRAYLHNELRDIATAEDGVSPPAKVHVSSKVISADPEEGELRLEDGTTIQADVVLGADGIYSKVRKFVTGTDYKLFRSGKAAFRFLIPRAAVEADPVTAPFVDKKNCLGIWFSTDRRIVIYPCNDNQLLNFVCIHPDTESHATASDEWNKKGSVEQLLKVYAEFDPALLRLIEKVHPDEVNVWQLLDMEAMPTWVHEKLALLGDAAHPFTPHQGQGAGQAMEDAAALAVVLPRGTSPEDVPERLRLYEEIRMTRAHTIQEFSRQAGKDRIPGKPPAIQMMNYTNYNFGHDEHDHATKLFNRYIWSKKKDLYWRMPLGFGPFPGPRQDFHGRRQPAELERTFTTMSVKFLTSRTFLETILPTESFRFKEPGTVCSASLSITRLNNMSWLGGGGYNHLGLYIHGIEYVKRDGTTIDGTHLAVLFESLADPIISGREELGMPKLFCDIDFEHHVTESRVRASWRGATFADISIKNLRSDDPETEHGTIGGEADYGILTYRYIPSVGEPGKADAEYACVVPHQDEARDIPTTVHAVSRSSDVSVKMEGHDWEKLPTLHHITRILAEVPIYEIVGAKVVEGTGVPNVSSCRRIE
ncbi:3-hydroxybenzoate 6-hydroxylase 2 [Colletotrichum chlorophyti]|uniref:3-hydroxybenzoate 6-hydroxylase 2 n=1 Tax=Colletotrichum chlorophyti TaxID=708187 RepID=A0A1Q8RVG5_9PEZI|nr:3-hydroxybenzoate 6-hydroxylase 2 [Colletotrichum chlorophyti]